jgi:acyl carrier protein
MTTAGFAVADLCNWVVARVATYVERPATEIDPNVPLAEYGMDSVYALGLCGDIEVDFGLDVDPTLAWQYPTAIAIAGYLSEQLSASGTRARSVTTPHPVPGSSLDDRDDR